ncbi:MAG: hypothetical protein PHH68_00230 [Candidatus Omnitrophica bacterium]|nr:hypothetical protein [Candidatus Omnitrophota bacterium]
MVSNASSILILALFVTVEGRSHPIVDDPLEPLCALLGVGAIGVHWSPSELSRS